MKENRAELHVYLESKLDLDSAVLSGIDPKLKFEVHSIRPSMRVDWNEQSRLQWVIELTQRIPQYLDPQSSNGTAPDYYFRGGLTPRGGPGTGEGRDRDTKAPEQGRRAAQPHLHPRRVNETAAN